MKISIIVPAFNEEAILGATLDSIRAAAEAFDEAGFTSELIVCDNNSTDATAAIGRDHGARVVFEPVNQIGRARNAGAAVATGEWLVFVDADSQPSRELFAAVAREIVAGRCLAGGSTGSVDLDELGARPVVGGGEAINRVGRGGARGVIFFEAGGFFANRGV